MCSAISSQLSLHQSRTCIQTNTTFFKKFVVSTNIVRIMYEPYNLLRIFGKNVNAGQKMLGLC
jgi:hypothetical protein